jgi:hypothetical protein
MPLRTLSILTGRSLPQVDVGGADALDAAVGEFAKMYVPK